MTKNPKSPDEKPQSDPASDQSIASTAQQTASNIAGIARDGASSQFARQKGQAASQLVSVAEALRQAGDQLRKKEQRTLPQYFALAADRIESLSGYVKTADVAQVVEGVEDFARRQPLLFVGGAFGLGLLAVRFLNSSGRRRASARAEGGRTTRSRATGTSASPRTAAKPPATTRAAEPKPDRQGGRADQ
jgi:hypothetical protein